jgi:sec-independent protein translocase protein TatC
MSKSQSFLFHFQELRKTIIKCLAAIFLLYIPSFFIIPHIIDFLVKWSCPEEMNFLNYFSPMEVFVIQLKMAFTVALAVSFPYCILQIWKFLLPALHKNERQALKLWVIFASFLFVLGSTFCILFILPLLMSFSNSFSTHTIRPLIGLSSFLGLASWLIVAFGVMFQFPIIIMVCVRFNILQHSFLSSKRAYIIVIILILSAILTPPDMLSQILLALPSYLLFELGLFLSKRFERNKN